eukprot:630047-Amorphochlora_amoeboformis.AAC.1
MTMYSDISRTCGQYRGSFSDLRDILEPGRKMQALWGFWDQVFPFRSILRVESLQKCISIGIASASETYAISGPSNNQPSFPHV